MSLKVNLPLGSSPQLVLPRPFPPEIREHLINFHNHDSNLKSDLEYERLLRPNYEIPKARPLKSKDLADHMRGSRVFLDSIVQTSSYLDDRQKKRYLNNINRISDINTDRILNDRDQKNLAETYLMETAGLLGLASISLLSLGLTQYFELPVFHNFDMFALFIATTSIIGLYGVVQAISFKYNSLKAQPRRFDMSTTELLTAFKNKILVGTNKSHFLQTLSEQADDHKRNIDRLCKHNRIRREAIEDIFNPFLKRSLATNALNLSILEYIKDHPDYVNTDHSKADLDAYIEAYQKEENELQSLQKDLNTIYLETIYRECSIIAVSSRPVKIAELFENLLNFRPASLKFPIGVLPVSQDLDHDGLTGGVMIVEDDNLVGSLSLTEKNLSHKNRQSMTAEQKQS